MENIAYLPHPGKTMLRVAAVALAPLMVPLTASHFVVDWNWPAKAFLFVYVLVFGIGMVYALIAGRMSVWSYKAGVAIALAASFALGWSTMVQTADSGHPERLWFLSVLAVGVAGASVSRLRATRLAYTLFAMAATLALLTLLLPPAGAPPDMALRMTLGHVGGVAIFVCAGLLFRRAGKLAQ